jgi:hypothetical protein
MAVERLADRGAGVPGPAAPLGSSPRRRPDSLIARLDRHVERMSKENPGLDFTRVDAVRSLLTRALDEIEGPSAPTKRGGR